MKDRFDLEDEITHLHCIGDNLNLVVDYLMEQDINPKVLDVASNALIGTKEILALHSNKMLDTMTQCFKLDNYRDSHSW
jgi:hypothetical protein